MSLYGEDDNKRYTIDHEYINYFEKTVWSLIGISDEPYGSSKYHGFFSIHEDLFDRILSTHKNKGIKLNTIGKYLDQIINKNIH